METIVTATYQSDAPRPSVAQDVAVEWLCFTDDANLEVPEPWEKIVEPAHFDQPALAAKVPKMLGPRRWLWIDANIEITSPQFARQALAAVHDGVATYAHPRRDCIYEEAEASLGSEAQNGKYDGLPIREQVASYRDEYPEHAGLYACGVVAWDGATAHLGTQWLAECARWTWQDQLSFPVVCRRLGIRPGIFGHRQIEYKRRGYLANRWLRIHPHS